MVLDGHIHMNCLNLDSEGLIARMESSGVDGGIILSINPDSFSLGTIRISAAERLKSLLLLTAGKKNLYPFFWIDPLVPNLRLRRLREFRE